MKTIPLSRGLTALVDDCDYDDLAKHKWHADENGYAVRNAPHPEKPGKTMIVRMHRVILGLKFRERFYGDHEDGNKANNQRYNLRVATHAQNSCNKVVQSNNTSGFKGVSWHKKNRLWNARIKLNGSSKCLGYYVTPELAFEAYCAAAKEVHGAFANTGVA